MVRSKDTLASVVKRFHVNKRLLQAVNQLKNEKLTPGKQIIIPTHTPVQQASIPSTRVLAENIKPGDTLYMVRRGDTIEKIARKFHTTPAAIRLANLIDNGSLMEGEKLVVPTHRLS